MLRKRLFLLGLAFIFTGWLSACDSDTTNSNDSGTEIESSYTQEEIQTLTDVMLSALPTVKENPAGTGQHGYPYGAAPTTSVYEGAAVVDLAGAGYVEREFMLSGTANTYNQSGIWGMNGKWKITVSKSNMPYTTRIIVRYPKKTSKFNGTVIFEWLNETTQTSTSPDWAESREFFLREGYAYVGVTAMNGQAGPAFLKGWDSQRYGTLSISTDGQSYDIFTQAAMTVKANSSTILNGLVPKNLLACGDSQSAFRITTYINAIHPVAKIYNGFLIHGRCSTAAPLGDGILFVAPITNIRTDNKTPVLQFQAEGDMFELLFTYARQSDNNYLRTWEIPGAAHIDQYEAVYELTITYRDLGWNPPVCQYGIPTGVGNYRYINSMSNHRLENAAWAALNKWVNYGTLPPASKTIQIIPFFNISVKDQYGNAKGGIRMAEVEVPTKTYSVINTGAAGSNFRETGLCIMSGYDTPFTAATLKKLYPTHNTYVTKYKAAAKKLLDAGFLTQVDYDEVVAEAQSAQIP